MQQRSLLEAAADDNFLGTAGGTTALGHIGNISPCIGPPPLHPNVSDPKFSRDMLWGSSFQCGILRGYSPRMLFDLSTITYKWDHTVKGICGDQRDLDLFIVVFNLFMDITTVILTLPVLWVSRWRGLRRLS